MFFVSVAARADHADDGSRYGGYGARAIVNLDDLDAVVIVAHLFNSVVKGCDYFLLCVRCKKRNTVGGGQYNVQ